MKRIQEGDKEAELQLWEQVKRFARMIAARILYAGKRAGAEMDDFMQAAFLAMLDAAEYFDVNVEGSFITVYKWFLLRYFRKLTGLISNSNSVNPTIAAVSLDAPVGEEQDTTLGELIEDVNAENPADAAESRLLRKTIMEAVETLPPEQQEVIIDHFFYGLPLDAVDKKQYGKALRALRKPEISNKLRGFL